MPVFVINGFLEAGKTQFITNTLQQDYFQADGTTVLILCEEGDTEYDKMCIRDSYTVVGVYKKEMSAFQKLLMGGSSDTGSAYIPYTLLTWPNDTFYYCRLYAKEGTDMVDLMSRLTAYLGKLKGRNAGDFYTNTVADEMGSIDSMMGGLSMAVGGIAAISLICLLYTSRCV